MTESSIPPETSAEPSEAKPRLGRTAIFAWFAGFAVFAYLLDQLVKLWVTSTMTYGQQIPVLPPFLRWYYITNPGAAFSIGADYTWVFTLIMIAVSIGILIAIRKAGSAWWGIGLGMVLGGALGNLTDRLFRPPSFGMGEVVDYISVPNFAVFNLADCAVVGGVIVICLLTLLGVPFRGGPRGAQRDGTDAAVEDAAEGQQP
ncbi:signal peptidase II [Acaricomes phytoseiuli]|uniref:signal peptidase II n=1 Tax=Acaricomes phytoseiuli TaxID=291968 RepID=UPI000376178A|nr:signal peptidase II [Acaricomes phytoseiuli]MCW1249560.1 signal peptidase II [Acaricomes phytoseiuli]